jgi:hypothetical protein
MMHPPSLSSRVHVPDGILNEHPSSSLQQILSILVIEYAVTESRCAEELLSLVARLQEKRLLEVVH